VNVLTKPVEMDTRKLIIEVREKARIGS